MEIRISNGPDEHITSIRSLYGSRPDLMARVVSDLGIHAFSSTARARIRDFGTGVRAMAKTAAELNERLLSPAGIARLDELNRELETMRIATGMTREQIAGTSHWLGIGARPSIYTVQPVRAADRVVEAEDDLFWRNVGREMGTQQKVQTSPALANAAKAGVGMSR